MINKICVFCGSSFGSNELYKHEVEKIGRLFGENGIELIYGGGNSGLMGALSKTTLESGGKVTGIIPKKIHEQVDHIDLTELHIVETMHERKNMMYNLADAFIALPGGIGTLEELAEIFTWQQIGYHQKPVAVWNINQFYNPFRDLLLHMVREGFMKKEFLENLIVDDNLEEIMMQLKTYNPSQHNKWEKPN
ncbi:MULTISPECIES: TIGR00730 family Rossman fold protein [Bacillaceae]|uniref:Cytokinin riboside 5'-monophosphate phosphoribohydrolase n=1 Tax=Evansella alkalicola TaxID=745819 RepID=A0ABS6K1E5_9BACI|nr:MULTISPECIES: TIGR00730 family Rossman fold protein [Bacillaceae]MBU9723749.1 TIGR00730 family Rossman fold protein [Bacillus alkalicola]